MRFLIFTCAIVLLGACTPQTPQPDVLDYVAGNWAPSPEASWYDPTHCGAEYHRTWISDDLKTVYQTHGDTGPDPGIVLAIKDSYITLRYPNEVRMDKDGNPRIWHMVFNGADSYTWLIKGQDDPDDPKTVKSIFETKPAYHRCPDQ